MIKCLNASFHLCVGGEAGGPTCVSVSALIVDAHRVLAHQELHHFQVFTVGARAGNNMSKEKVSLCLNTAMKTRQTIPVEGRLAEDVLF